MEQSKFIFEVKTRQCLWNPFVISYLDRFKKRQAWQEIAAKMYRDFDSCSDKEKIEKVRELQKKWKSLKDYYKRRNPKLDIDKKTKQKKPIVVLLQFLEKVTKLHHRIRSEQHIAEKIKNIKNKNFVFKLPDYKVTLQKFKDNEVKPYNTRKRNVLSPKQSSDHGSQQNQMKLLLSLLPIMQSLNDRQRFQFKLEVMMLIKKIKYEEEETRKSTEISPESYDKIDQQ